MGKPCGHSGCVYPIFSHGYCKFHQGERKDDKYKESKKSFVQKHMEKMKATNGQRSEEQEKKLHEWFDYHMKHSPKVCENCSCSLEHYNEKDWRGSQHHLLEKSLYPSVESLLDNHGVLGKWCCHSQWHSSWEKASQMPFFPIAIKRIEKFIHMVKEKSKLNDILLQELNPELL